MAGVQTLLAHATTRRQFTFYHYVPGRSWYSFDRHQKDERLSRPWSHPVVLNQGPLDWESCALTTSSNFSLNPVPLDEHYQEKRKGPGVS